MASTPVVRKYQNDDRETCRALWRELTIWHQEIYQDSSIGGEHPEDYFDSHLNKVGPDQLWVAVYGSKVVGLVGLIVEEGEAEIEPLIVSKNCRGQGVGTKLVETVVSEAQRRKVRFLDVKPVARNMKTIRFLHKLGFRNLGRIDMFMNFSDSIWKSGIKIHECEFNF
jgi:ribosomal protein S18 acetylase RimI-like enzyme